MRIGMGFSLLGAHCRAGRLRAGHESDAHGNVLEPDVAGHIRRQVRIAATVEDRLADTGGALGLVVPQRAHAGVGKTKTRPPDKSD